MKAAPMLEVQFLFVTGLIIYSYNFIVIKYFTEFWKNDTLFTIFTKKHTGGYVWNNPEQFIKAISSFSFNSKKGKFILFIEILCDGAINLSFREGNLWKSFLLFKC
jgi:hypothetical protein